MLQEWMKQHFIQQMPWQLLRDLGRINLRVCVDFSQSFGTESLFVSPTLAVFKKWILKNTWAGHLNLILPTLQYFLSLQAGVSGCLQKMPLPPSTDSTSQVCVQGVPSHTHSTFKAAHNSSIVYVTHLAD